jgi:hypothetical protein
MESRFSNFVNRRFHRRSLVVMLLYVLALAVMSLAIDHLHLRGVGLVLLALLPALPIVAGIVVIAQYLSEQKDEFVRALLIESMLWGVGATLIVTTVWGALEKFAHIRAMSLFLVYPLCCVFVILARVVVKRRYR